MTDSSRDDQAERLATLQVQRDKTGRELELIESATRSNRRTLESFAGACEGKMASFTDRLSAGGLSPEERQSVLESWQVALLESAQEFRDLLAEWERLQVQEKIVVRMTLELDEQIEQLGKDLTAGG
jgi:hypothetical protein